MLLSDDSVILQLILNRIGQVGARCSHSILKAAMLGRVQFKNELVTFVFVRNARDDDGADRAVVKGEARTRTKANVGNGSWWLEFPSVPGV